MEGTTQQSTTINEQETAILNAVKLFAAKGALSEMREQLDFMFTDSLTDSSMNDEDNRADRIDAYTNLKYLLRAINKAYNTLS